MLNSQEMIREIARPTDSKIVLLVIDGLGGLPLPETGLTELETARTPNLDRLAAGAVCGLVDPVAPGITPGSAPGHLALFGYDPVGSIIGRGVLEALGIDFELQPGDVAARGNFATVDGEGIRMPYERGGGVEQLVEHPGARIDVEDARGDVPVGAAQGRALRADPSVKGES